MGSAASPSTSHLKRAVLPIPSFVRAALVESKLLAAYRSRPAYQRNDYIGWITRAKREATQLKRIAQMLDELEDGELYMNMKWEAGVHRESRAPRR
jgi:uncharacterized protein YdeI (YjbR/CyaY-like superfamily)